MQLKAGMRLRSVTSTAQVIIVKAPGGEVDLRCGGVAMTDAPDAASDVEIADGFSGETVLGKRYGNDDDTLLMLVTKAGDGALTVGDVPLERKDAKALPSSD